MPTNDERREVAARLREHQHGDVRCPTLEGGMVASWWRLKDALCAEGSDPQEDHTMMFGYLADLIEPEPELTCWNDSLKRGKGVFHCSKCGIHLDIADMEEEDMDVFYEPSFCPSCDARVKEDIDAD